MHTQRSIIFYRRIGRSGRIAVPQLFKDRLVGKTVKITIEPLDDPMG